MASSYTTRIRLEKQADGENPNSWGAILNQNVIDLIDDAVGAYTTIGTSGSQIVGDSTLTTNEGASDEARSAALEIQGFVVSASAANIVLPSQSGFYLVRNKVTQTSTTGTLRFITAANTATGFTVNTSTTYASDSSNIFLIINDGANVFGLNRQGLGFQDAVERDVLTSLGEIDTTTVDPITSVTAVDNVSFTNTTAVNPKLLALSTTDQRYAKVSAGYTNTNNSTNIFVSVAEFNGETKASAAQVYTPFVTLTPAASVSIDFSTGNNFIIPVSSNMTLAQPHNMKVGQVGAIYLIQDATSGGKTVSYDSTFKFINDNVPVMTTSISAVDLAVYVIRDVQTTVTAATTVTIAAIDILYNKDLKRL